jgi:predicted DNA binding protein
LIIEFSSPWTSSSTFYKLLAIERQEKTVVVKDICTLMGISKPTLYVYVRQAQSSA